MDYRAGFVGLIGQPNAGKSTLMNLLIEEKVSIVTSKPQTTRRRVLGICNLDRAQIVFVDAPGVLNADKGLNKFLMQEAQDVIDSSDALVAVLSVDEKEKEDIERIIEMVVQSKKPWMVVINKADLVDKRHRVEMIRDMVREYKVPVHALSAKTMDGFSRRELFDEIVAMLPETPAPLYDVDLFTPHTSREIAAEIIREKCFENLHHEVPYNLAVRITKYDESRDDLVKIYADIVVSKETHKPIVIGKGGAVIKEIGVNARKDLETLIGTKVFLDLDVSVRPEWSENRNIMKELGYESEQKRK